MVLGAQNNHIRQMNNFITVNWCILTKFQPKLLRENGGLDLDTFLHEQI